MTTDEIIQSLNARIGKLTEERERNQSMIASMRQKLEDTARQDYGYAAVIGELETIVEYLRTASQSTTYDDSSDTLSEIPQG